jgi:hypothetical protein
MAAYSAVNRAGTGLLTFPLHLIPGLRIRGAVPDLPNALHKAVLNKALSQMHFYNKV